MRALTHVRRALLASIPVHLAPEQIRVRNALLMLTPDLKVLLHVSRARREAVPVILRILEAILSALPAVSVSTGNQQTVLRATHALLANLA